ncbi:MAG TPA: SLBB domain-containing protein [Gemmatimonadales bacterium]|nr:SLBB domain-containing protein [Gemmatimonadales bacterium]
MASSSRHRGQRVPIRCLALCSLLIIGAPGLAAQDPLGGRPPPPDAARDLVRSRPDLVRQLRERLRLSGLTPDQVRARLRAAGYPEHLLDAYLADADTTRVVQPTRGTFDALRALGLLGAEAVDSLVALDSLRSVSDSARRVADSLRLARLDSLRADSLADTLAARGRLKRFGAETFRRAGTRFQPLQTGPVDANYRLGPGDLLVLVLTGDVEDEHALEVTRDGFIVIPRAGQLYVANLTLGQLEDQLYARLGRVYSGVRRGPGARTKFSVTVARLRSVQVFVSGDVVRPGAYQISSTGTPLSALYAAGGPSDNGSFRRIEVRRGTRLVDSVDLYDYLVRGIQRNDFRLESGDVVFVPVQQGQIKVAGAVARPAVYELKPGETLRHLLEFAGGFAPEAYRTRVQIHRLVSRPGAAGRPSPARVVVDVAPEELAAGVPDVPLAPGDSVTVFALPERVTSYVTVRGNVWVDGRVGFRPGMRLSEAIRLAGGVRPDVYLERVLVTRVAPDSSRVQLRSAFADTLGTLVDDLVLEDRDEIEVFSRSSARPRPFVTVTGAVRTPGRITYRRGMTLRDAVLLAGGVTEDAYLEVAEIARRVSARGSGGLAETIRVTLDSAYALGTDGVDGLRVASVAPDVPLQPYDNVLIMREGGFERQRLVHLSGQVKRPGRYALRSKTERLADLIQRAGGLTEEAYPGGIEFWRPIAAITPRPAPPERPDTLPDPRPITTGPRERVGVDLARALRDARSADNLILTAGDSIHVPEYDPVVMVLGAVNAPGAVAYAPGKSADWYVRAAGGYAQLGDPKRVYVTQPNGQKESVRRRFLLPDGVPEPRAGGQVFVPERAPTTQPSNTPAVLGAIASILGALTTIAVVVSR